MASETQQAPASSAERIVAAPDMDAAIESASTTASETLSQIVQDFVAHLPLLAAGLIILIVTAAASFVAKAITNRVLRDVHIRGSLKELVIRFVVLAVWTVGLLLAAMVTFPGLTPSRALAALGVGSIAIGLAFKDIFENFFAGVLILWRFPFENGDWITCNGITGRVVTITVRNTILRTVSGELIVVPNVDLYKNPVDVLTNRPRRRVEITCGVAYGTSIPQARDAILASVRQCETVSDDDPVLVFADEFADSSINFRISWWTDSTPLGQLRSRDEVLEAVKQTLDEHGIEIPFPQRVVTLRDGGIAVEEPG